MKLCARHIDKVAEHFCEAYRKGARASSEAQGEFGRCFEAWYPNMEQCVVASVHYFDGDCI